MPRITRVQAAYMATDPPLPAPQTSIISQNVGKLALDVLDLEARIAALEPPVGEVVVNNAQDPIAPPIAGAPRSRRNRKTCGRKNKRASRKNNRN